MINRFVELRRKPIESAPLPSVSNKSENLNIVFVPRYFTITLFSRNSAEIPKRSIVSTSFVGYKVQTCNDIACEAVASTMEELVTKLLLQIHFFPSFLIGNMIDNALIRQPTPLLITICVPFGKKKLITYRPDCRVSTG